MKRKIILVLLTVLVLLGALYLFRMIDKIRIENLKDIRIAIKGSSFAFTIDLYSTGTGLSEKIYNGGTNKIIVITQDRKLIKYTINSYYVWDPAKGYKIYESKKLNEAQINELINGLKAIGESNTEYSSKYLEVNIDEEKTIYVDEDNLNNVLIKYGVNF